MTTNELNDVLPLRNYECGFEGFTPNEEFVLPSDESINGAWKLNGGKDIKGTSSPKALADWLNSSSGSIRGVVDLGDGRLRIFGFGVPNSADKKCPIIIPDDLRSALSSLTDEQYAEKAEGLLWSCKPDHAYAFSSFCQDYAFDCVPRGRGEYYIKAVQSAASFIKEVSTQIPDITEEDHRARLIMWRAADYLGSR
jgi:hypothetical protein